MWGVARVTSLCIRSRVNVGPSPPWLRGRLAGQRIIAQPHCHHHAVMGWDADGELLPRVGRDLDGPLEGQGVHILNVDDHVAGGTQRHAVREGM